MIRPETHLAPSNCTLWGPFRMLEGPIFWRKGLRHAIGRRSKSRKYLLVQGFLCVLCTDTCPWNHLNKVCHSERSLQVLHCYYTHWSLNGWQNQSECWQVCKELQGRMDPQLSSPCSDLWRIGLQLHVFSTCCTLPWFKVVGAFYPTLLDWSKTALETEVSLHGSKDGVRGLVVRTTMLIGC